MNTLSKSVSCLIVNYNSGLILHDCVVSVLNNICVFEIIIIDNASKDKSIQHLLQKLPESNIIKVIRNPINVGFGAACNQAVKLAIGDYLLFLNPDCEIATGTIERLLYGLSTNPGVGMTGPMLLNKGGSEQAGGRRYIPNPLSALRRVFHVGQNFNMNKEPIPCSAQKVDAISGACMLVSREAFIDVGGFDEGYFLHCEDLDLCMRFREKGWGILFVPDAKVTHYAGTCSRNRYLFVEWNKHKGMLRFYRKFYLKKYPLPLYWLVWVGVWGRFGILSSIHGIRRLLLRPDTIDG